MNETIKIAAVQTGVTLGKLQANLDRIESKLLELRENGIFLVVFPECALTGYCFDSRQEAADVALDADHPALSRVRSWSQDFGINIVFGYLESAGKDIFNSAALVTTSGEMHVYRKVHLPFLGVDRFATPGNRPFAVHDVHGVRIGLNICYDCSFPEPSRILSLQGADLIVLPTNWPPGSGSTADYIPNARALENNVYFMAVNRIGMERGFEFIGKSKICHPDGHDLAFADHRDEATLIVEIDPAVARAKRLVRVPGKHEIDRFLDRRPEMYGGISMQPRQSIRK